MTGALRDLHSSTCFLDIRDTSIVLKRSPEGKTMAEAAAAFVLPGVPLLRAGPSRRLVSATSKKRPRAMTARRSVLRAETGYIPADDDKAEPTSDVPNQLTLPQQLLLKQYEEQVERMGPEECRKLAVEIARQMMVKDNILRTMLKTDVNFGVEPPDPDDLQPPEEKV